MLTELQAFADDLLRASPAVEIGPVRFMNDDRSFRAHVRVDVDGAALPAAGVGGIEAYEDWVALISAEGTSEIDKNMAREFAAELMKAQLRASIDAKSTAKMSRRIEAMARQQAPLILRSFVERGFLDESGNFYSTRFSLADGALSVNGIAMPVRLP